MKNKLPKEIIVTGAASGIGLAITTYLAKKGDRVFAADINETALKKLADLDNNNIIPIFMDVTNIESLLEARKQIAALTTALDGLVNNAGVFVGGPLVEISERRMEQIFAVNVLGVYKTTKAFFPLLLQRKGRIVNIGSEAGRLAFPMNGPYSMTKYALEAFSDALRRELMFLGMRVIHLQLGAIDTPLLDTTIQSYSQDFDPEHTHFSNLLSRVVTSCKAEKGRCASPETVAKVVFKVMHKKHTRARYRVKNNRSRRLLEFVPENLLDKIMLRVLK